MTNPGPTESDLNEQYQNAARWVAEAAAADVNERLAESADRADRWLRLAELSERILSRRGRS